VEYRLTMQRHVRKVTSPDRLEWTVKRLVVPAAMRPPGPIDTMEAATPRRTAVDGMPGTVRDAFFGVTGPMPLGALLVVFLLPFLPAVLLLRRLGLLRWTIEARTYPWGRRYPPVVLTYAIRGGDAALTAVDRLADALVRGDGAPVLADAEFISQTRVTHDGTNDRAIFGRPR
jgi:hypothetical protein